MSGHVTLWQVHLPTLKLRDRIRQDLGDIDELEQSILDELVSSRCRHCGRRIETDYVDRHLWWHSSDMTVHCDADRMEESTLAEPEDWER